MRCLGKPDDPPLKRKLERQARDARRGRLGGQRFGLLVMELTAVSRMAFEAGAVGSVFGLEGPMRHAVRADLCLQGWRWREADILARDAMDEALRKLNAERPTWKEGQLEWTVEAGTLIERTRCVRCHKPLPEGHHKFCGSLCRAVSHQKAYRLRQAQSDMAIKLAIRRI